MPSETNVLRRAVLRALHIYEKAYVSRRLIAADLRGENMPRALKEVCGIGGSAREGLSVHYESRGIRIQHPIEQILSWPAAWDIINHEALHLQCLFQEHPHLEWRFRTEKSDARRGRDGQVLGGDGRGAHQDGRAGGVSPVRV